MSKNIIKCGYLEVIIKEENFELIKELLGNKSKVINLFLGYALLYLNDWLTVNIDRVE